MLSSREFHRRRGLRLEPLRGNQRSLFRERLWCRGLAALAGRRTRSSGHRRPTGALAPACRTRRGAGMAGRLPRGLDLRGDVRGATDTCACSSRDVLATSLAHSARVRRWPRPRSIPGTALPLARLHLESPGAPAAERARLPASRSDRNARPGPTHRPTRRLQRGQPHTPRDPSGDARDLGPRTREPSACRTRRPDGGWNPSRDGGRRRRESALVQASGAGSASEAGSLLPGLGRDGGRASGGDRAGRPPAISTEVSRRGDQHGRRRGGRRLPCVPAPGFGEFGRPRSTASRVRGRSDYGSGRRTRCSVGCHASGRRLDRGRCPRSPARRMLGLRCSKSDRAHTLRRGSGSDALAEVSVERARSELASQRWNARLLGVSDHREETQDRPAPCVGRLLERRDGQRV